MKKVCISKDWYLMPPNSREYIKVDLPNDYSVTRPRSADAPGGASNGYFNGGHGRYVKYIQASDDARHTILDVDGAYMCAEVYLNGDKLAFHPYGYTPFLVDLTDKLLPGQTNKIAIETNDMQPSTRWYSGAGLYRDVFLWRGGEVRIEPWDTFVSTLRIEPGHAVIKVAYEVTSDIAGEAVVSSEVVAPSGTAVASNESAVRLVQAGKATVEFELTIPAPQLWDVDSPALYTLNTEIHCGQKLTDTATMTFGIRTVSADAEHGLLLNGRSIKLRGGCIHHDHGVLGAAAFPAAEERKLTILKNAGFNAVRTAHYPPSLALLEVCDRIGMLVMDEAFDMWRTKKNNSDYHLWFEDWYERDIASMVLRDRNHPCVISYSIGNEIPERDGASDGAAWSARLADEIRKYDATRLVTSGVCGLWNRPEPIDPPEYVEAHRDEYANIDEAVSQTQWADKTEGYMAPLDIVGYNYLYPRYAEDHKRYPNRVIWGSETKVLYIYDSWKAVMDNSHVIGDFTWTCYDNLGEAGTGRFMWAREGFIPHIQLSEYPWRMCFQGDMDLCGFPRPQAYYREAVWRGEWLIHIFTTHPEHHGEGFSGTDWHWHDVCDSWTFDDKYIGKPVKAEVYTGADEVAFILNGAEVARSAPEKCVAYADINYAPGELTAIAYKDGREVGRHTLVTVGAATKLAIAPEKESIKADRRDLAYFDITVQDEQGRHVPDAGCAITCVVDGGELMGVYSGDPANEDEYGSDRCHTFKGRALAVVRTNTPGTVTVTVGGASLRTASASVKAN